MKEATRLDTVCPFCGSRVQLTVVMTWSNSQYGGKTKGGLFRRNRTRVLVSTPFATSTHECKGPQ